MRLFVAAEVAAAVRASAASGARALAADLPGGARAVPVDADAMHVTLVFLGEVGPERLPQIKDALAAAPRVPEFSAVFAGVGAFPGPARARILWAGVAEGVRELTALAEAVRLALSAPGGASVETGDRPFVPHLTMCRFRPAARIDSLAVFGRLQDTEWGRCPIQRLVLFESRLSAAGPSYTARAEIALPPA